MENGLIQPFVYDTPPTAGSILDSRMSARAGEISHEAARESARTGVPVSIPQMDVEYNPPPFISSPISRALESSRSTALVGNPSGIPRTTIPQSSPVRGIRAFRAELRGITSVSQMKHTVPDTIGKRGAISNIMARYRAGDRFVEDAKNPYMQAWLAKMDELTHGL